MAIETDKVIVVPAEPEKTYDKVWFSKIQINADDPNSEANAFVEFRLFRNDATGFDEYGNTIQVNEFAEGDAQRFYVYNLFLEAQTNSNVANAMGALFIALTEQAKKQNLI